MSDDGLVSRYLNRPLSRPVARALSHTPAAPNVLTATTLLVAVVSAGMLAAGWNIAGGIAIQVVSVAEGVDGELARLKNMATRFGAVFDSTLDRYAEGLLFMGLSAYFARKRDYLKVALCGAAINGSFMVSYVRARAEGLGLDCKVGLLTRMERVFIILAMLITGLVVPGLWILVVGTHLTVIQRVWYVYRTLKQQGDDTR